jgi:hypothetical protein
MDIGLFNNNALKYKLKHIQKMNKVTIKIADNSKEIQIPFQMDTNVQEALEKAYDQEKAAGRKFDFAVQYFGYFGAEYGGYQVVMIDKIYDNPSDPNDYWKLIVNGVDAQVGIDSYMVNAGDVIEFDYVKYVVGTNETMLLKSKHDFYSKN